jgi:hypothetical protein
MDPAGPAAARRLRWRGDGQGPADHRGHRHGVVRGFQVLSNLRHGVLSGLSHGRLGVVKRAGRTGRSRHLRLPIGRRLAFRHPFASHDSGVLG